MIFSPKPTVLIVCVLAFLSCQAEGSKDTTPESLESLALTGIPRGHTMGFESEESHDEDSNKEKSPMMLFQSKIGAKHKKPPILIPRSKHKKISRIQKVPTQYFLRLRFSQSNVMNQEYAFCFATF